MDSYIIQIQPQDELTVIIDKIIQTQAERVYLLIPEQSRIAQNVLNLRLLKREADSLGKEVVVVSASHRVQALALKASLQVHQETDELRRGIDSGSTESPMLRPPLMRDIVTSPESSDIGEAENGEVEVRQPAQKIPIQKVSIQKPELSRKKKEKKAPKSSEAASGQAKEDKLPDKERTLEPILKISGYVPESPESGTSGPDMEEGRVPENSAFVKFWTRDRSAIPKSSSSALMGKLSFFSKLSSAHTFKHTLVAFVALSFVAAGLAFYYVLPKAKIHITTFVEAVTLEINIQGDVSTSKIQPENFVIPAQIFEKSITHSMNVITTGEKEINEKAQGTINVYNAFSSAPQTLVETTRFVSEGGKLFRTTETIVVPGAEVVEGKIVPKFTTVTVAAAEAGGEYNIDSSSFSIPGFKGTPKYLAFYGKSESAMQGGRTGVVKVVSGDDYKNSEAELKKVLDAKAAQELDISVGKEFIVPEGAKFLSEATITSSANIGDEEDAFIMSGAISLKAFAIRQADVLELLKNDFEQRFLGKKLIPNGEEITYVVKGTNFDDGILDTRVSYAARAATEVLADKIKEGIRGKNESGVRAYLSSQPGVREAKVTFWPFWVSNMPQDISKIDITIEP